MALIENFTIDLFGKYKVFPFTKPNICWFSKYSTSWIKSWYIFTHWQILQEPSDRMETTGEQFCHSFLFWLRSGLWVDHSNVFRFLVLNHGSVGLAVCLQSLSCCKVNLVSCRLPWGKRNHWNYLIQMCATDLCDWTVVKLTEFGFMHSTWWGCIILKFWITSKPAFSAKLRTKPSLLVLLDSNISCWAIKLHLF